MTRPARGARLLLALLLALLGNHALLSAEDRIVDDVIIVVDEPLDPAAPSTVAAAPPRQAGGSWIPTEHGDIYRAVWRHPEQTFLDSEIGPLSGDVAAASSAAHAIVAGRGNVISGRMREGNIATLNDMKRIGEAMEFLGKHGEADGAEGARRIYREGQRMADGMLQDGRIRDPGERKGTMEMRERLRLSEAQARFAKADVLENEAEGMHARATGAGSEGEQNFYAKRAEGMRHEAQAERRQAGRQAADALSAMSGTVGGTLAEMGRNTYRGDAGSGQALRRTITEAGDLLTLAGAAQRLDKDVRPVQFEMRTADGHGIADRLEAIADGAGPGERNMLKGLTAAAEGRYEDSAKFLAEAERSGVVTPGQSDFESLIKSMSDQTQSSQPLDSQMVTRTLADAISTSPRS